jgi:predicted transcriptional regulator
VKKLIVSVKTPSEALEDFVRVCKSVQERKVRGVHRELAFDNRKAFDRFVSNLVILSQIASLKPKSVYELAKATGRDISNLNKVVAFLEEVGVIRVKKSVANGRPIKTPIVDYDRIEFRLRADPQ